MENDLPKIFRTLPSYSDELFKALWLNKKLGYSDINRIDQIDVCNAQLICEAIRRNDRLLITLPDFSPHRPALLFATTLLSHVPALAYARSDNQSSNVLYFGNSIGIREQLKKVRIVGKSMVLGDVFNQTNITRRGDITSAVLKPKNNLPQVITIYSPANPLNLISRYSPMCIAIDLDDAPEVNWLEGLLQACANLQIPVLAWNQNGLSECTQLFKNFGKSVIWSPQIKNSNGDLGIQNTTDVQPTVIDSAEASALSLKLQKATRFLLELSSQKPGKFAFDCIGQHWRIIRNIEALSVPVDFYESEAENFFGLKCFSRLQVGGEHFRKALNSSYPTFIEPLEKTSQLCEEILSGLQHKEPPLWSALTNYCISDFSEEFTRNIVFSGRSRKELFLLAMLFFYNITEEDLAEIGIHILTLSELLIMAKEKCSSETTSEKRQQILMVGLPSPAITGRLLPLLFYNSVNFLIYPHQAFSLRKRFERINKMVSFDGKNWGNILSHYRKSTEEVGELASSSNRIHLYIPELLEITTVERRKVKAAESLWQIGNPIAEIEKILNFGDEAESDSFIFHESQSSDASESADLWCEEVIEIKFADNSLVRYSIDEKIQIVRYLNSGVAVEEGYVRALKQGDRIVFIHNQQRQNFYDLLISRVHQNPGMVFHLSLIRRWQEDFLKTYREWVRHDGRNIESLLKLMQSLGSRLMTSATLRNWLQGKTLCPEDMEDLHRLAEILSMSYVKAHYKKINTAAKRLRGLHIGLSRKLNRWLTGQVKGGVSRDDDEIIDVDLNLTFADLRDSLVLLDVKIVKKLNGLWLRSDLGKLEHTSE
jgi:hypothetical protein